MNEKTLILLKPDGVEQNLESVVAQEISGLGLRIVERRKMQLDRRVVAEHYAHHSDKPFFSWLCTYMTRGPVIGMIIEGDDAVAKIRELVGATDPEKAAPHTLRRRYGRRRTDGYVENVMHASEKTDEAEVEIVRFFGRRGTWWSRFMRWFSPGKAAQL